MRRDVLVYISGPMTPTLTKSIEQHTAQGVDAFLTLMRHGIPAFCPMLGGGYPSVWTALTHEEWVQYDKVMIERCTHVVMIGQWEQSKGACLEKAYAESLNIPVVFGLQNLFTRLGVHHG